MIDLRILIQSSTECGGAVMGWSRKSVWTMGGRWCEDDRPSQFVELRVLDRALVAGAAEELASESGRRSA